MSGHFATGSQPAAVQRSRMAAPVNAAINARAPAASVLLANHGPVVAGVSLDAAANAIEELEETAKLFLLLRGEKTRFLTAEQVAEVRAAFPD